VTAAWQAATNVQDEFEKDPDLLKSMFTWLVVRSYSIVLYIPADEMGHDSSIDKLHFVQVGSLLYLLGLFIFLFSEINAVLITRDSVSLILIYGNLKTISIRAKINERN
jgi:hypothetical protein